MRKAERGRGLKLALNFAVAAVFVWLVARNVNGAALWRALMATRLPLVAAAVGLFLCGYACRIARWRVMLRADDRHGVGWSRIGGAFFSSIALNNVLPLRAGDLFRVFGLSRVMAIPVATLLATLLVERLLDLLCLDLALGLSLPLLRVEGAALIGLGTHALLVAGAVLLVFLLFPRRFEPLANAVLKLAGVVAPGLALRLRQFSQHTFSALHGLSHGPRMAVLVLWSLAAWAFEGSVFVVLALAVPAMQVPRAGLLAFPVGTLATILPSTPGYVGTFDFFVVKAAQALGNSGQAAAAYAVVVHLVLWLPATLIGGLCLLAGGTRLADVRQLQSAQESDT